MPYGILMVTTSLSGAEFMGGGGDEYSRMIVFLKCLPNNFATTVLQELEKGVQLYGLPEKVRTGQGGENVEMWRIMESIHGTSSSVVTGSSTHNERLERMLNDIWQSRNCITFFVKCSHATC